MTPNHILKLLSALTVSTSLAWSATAQTGPIGIAFVQAPEQSSGVAVSDNMGVAISHAVDECVRGGAMVNDCVITDWCMCCRALSFGQAHNFF